MSDNGYIDPELYKLVWAVLWRYKFKIPPCLERQDLYQMGCIGLVKAVKSYNPDNKKGASLASYCYIKIKYSIIDQLRTIMHARTANEALYRAERLSKTMYSEDERLTRIGFIGAEDSNIQRFEENQLLETVMGEFTERDKYIFRRFIRGGMFMYSIGKRVGLSGSRVSQIITSFKKRYQEVRNGAL